MVGLISLFCSIVLFVILQCVHVGICIIHECQTTKKVVQVTDLILIEVSLTCLHFFVQASC